MKEKELDESRERVIEANRLKALPWRPNNSKTDFLPVNTKQSQSSTSTKSSQAKTEPFYMSGNSNAKGSVFRQYPNSKSVRKVIPILAISDKEENLTTKDVNYFLVNFVIIHI